MAHRSYGLFSNDMQKHVKSILVTWWQTVRNGHIITYVLILLNSNENQKILYTKVNQYIIHINLLEEPEMQVLRLRLDGTHEGDCKNPEKH